MCTLRTTFGPRETNSYTSLVRLDDARFAITYDLHRRVQEPLPPNVTGVKECVPWPTPEHDKTGCEQGGAARHDGHVYYFNTGRGTPSAVCGEDAHCDCCRSTNTVTRDVQASFSMAVRIE